MSTKVRRTTAAIALCAAWAALSVAPAARAQTDVSIVALFTDRAMVSINGGKPRLMKAGETMDGVRLVAADSQRALVEVDGRRETLTLGQHIATQRSAAGRQTTVLSADGRGHFWASGQINGAAAKFLVDTGATNISMSSAAARALGINYLRGERGLTSTANGIVPVYRITLASVRVGEITLNNVEASVHEGNALPVILLGMSFLNRVEMQRDGDRMTLIRRF
jgi:aspartyl protease family protein